MAKRSKHTRPAGFTAERAKFWCVSVRVMQLWLRKSVPVESVEKMIEWYSRQPAAAQKRLSPAFQRRVTELRTGTGSAQIGTPGNDPEFAEFQTAYREGKLTDKTLLADLKEQAAFYQFKQRQCSSRNDAAGASDALRQLTGLSGIIHDMELRAQKLGRDLGDLVPRKTLEDPARFLGYHLMRCADAAREEIAQALKVTDPAASPLLPEEIRRRIDPILLNAFVLQPIRRASAGDNQAAPPDWLVACLDAGLSEVLENITLDRAPTPAVPGA